jgi:hypothetical protein
MHYKVLWTTSYVNQDSAVDSLGRVDRDAQRGIVEAGTCKRVELPAVPGAAQDQRPREVVTTRATRDALHNRPEAERATMVGAAIANAAKFAVYRHDADLPSFHSRHDVTVPLEIGERADVVPAHAGTSPRRSP